MHRDAPTSVGPLLHLAGRLSRSVPYFSGRWRLLDWAFHRYFKHTRKSEVVQLRNHIQMECNLWDEVQFNIWVGGFQYELRESRWVCQTIQPGMVFLDVGANVGYYSLLLAPRVGPTGAIHAFEPVSSSYEIFCRNVQRSDLKNVVVNRLIVSDSPGKKVINVGADDNAGTASLSIVSRRDRLTETVESVTLDDYVREQNLPRVDAIKIDVQGHEMPVLKGALGTLRQRKPLVLIEIHTPSLRGAGSSREEVYDLLEHEGFEAFRVQRNGELERLVTPQDGVLIVFRPKEPR